MNRRELFISSLAAPALTTIPFLARAQQADHPRPPFQTIYSNDTTHILSCIRPEERDIAFTDELLQKSIREAAGVDAHFLQPGLGWIPWWKSKIYPLEEHYSWLEENFGIKGTRKIDQYLLNGGDMLQTLVDTCQDTGTAPFLSFRLNDGHHVRDLAKALERGKPTQKISRHYWENYEQYRLGPDTSDWDQGVFDWSIPEVRDFKFALIEEACANYDLAGLELDFLRHWVRFGEHTSPEERFRITTEFVRKIRTMLDRTAAARGLPRRWLCVRVPANAAVRPDQGIDLASLTKAGVDMINLSYSYFTWQDDNAARARIEAGEKPAIYVEMTHTPMTGRATAGSGTQPYLRTTEEQFYTTARLAREQGADGVSLFNFPYYRYHVTDSIGPFHEPPFHVLPKLKDPSFLEKQAQWYFISSGRNDRVLGERQLPAILNRNTPRTFSIQMLSSKPPHTKGILRLRSDEEIADRVIEVRLNKQLLSSIPSDPMPLSHPYEATWIGKPDELACYAIPAEIPILENSQVEVLVKTGIRVRLIYLDVILT